MNELIIRLSKDFPDITFSEGNSFRWSPENKEITYIIGVSDDSGAWAILHELGHSLLGHTSYISDFGLLRLEADAWKKASEIAIKYGKKINKDHMENCLDTYRDWLHRRSKCPLCSNVSLQYNTSHYKCFNCHTAWKVSTSRFCRPYRQISSENKISPAPNEQAIFS